MFGRESRAIHLILIYLRRVLEIDFNLARTEMTTASSFNSAHSERRKITIFRYVGTNVGTFLDFLKITK